MNDRLTAEYMFDHMVPKILAENPDIGRRVNAVLGIELTGESGGYWTLELSNDASIERGKTKEPKCTLRANARDFESVVASGSIRTALEAWKQKRIQASGHLPTILKLEQLLAALARR